LFFFSPPIRSSSFRLNFIVIMDWHLQEFYKNCYFVHGYIYEVIIWYFPILWLKLILICFYDTPNPKFSYISSVQNSMLFYVLVLKCCHLIFIVVFLLQAMLPTVISSVDVFQSEFSFLCISVCYLPKWHLLEH
jgi:hypothetical protein